MLLGIMSKWKLLVCFIMFLGVMWKLLVCFIMFLGVMWKLLVCFIMLFRCIKIFEQKLVCFFMQNIFIKKNKKKTFPIASFTILLIFTINHDNTLTLLWNTCGPTVFARKVLIDYEFLQEKHIYKLLHLTNKWQGCECVYLN